MGPRQLFLELVNLVLCLPGLLRLGITGKSLLISTLVIRQRLRLGLQDPLRLRDVLQARGVFLAELTKLGATKEKLAIIERTVPEPRSAR